MSPRVVVENYNGDREMYEWSLAQCLEYARTRRDTGIFRISVFNHNNIRVYCQTFPYSALPA